jgi:hypothetical protein
VQGLSSPENRCRSTNKHLSWASWKFLQAIYHIFHYGLLKDETLMVNQNIPNPLIVPNDVTWPPVDIPVEWISGVNKPIDGHDSTGTRQPPTSEPNNWLLTLHPCRYSPRLKPEGSKSLPIVLQLIPRLHCPRAGSKPVIG